MKYTAICNNTSRVIHGAASPKDALEYAIKVYNDCLDHTGAIEIWDMDGGYLIGEDD